MSRGGSASWRSAIRAAATLLARARTDSVDARYRGEVVGRSGLLAALSLAALIAYLVADASGLAPEQLDWPQILAAGAPAAYGLLATHLPGPDAMLALQANPAWAYRAERWPEEIVTIPASEQRTDPATIAWAKLTAPAPPSAQAASPSSPPAPFESAYGTVRTLVTDQSRGRFAP